ncbi:MAG: ABC transporter substrate-binding protein, partial [Planctomycetes bacterium]|nr:ABC transporter substrate-binding protein [Planctomycetota bacterium]
FAVSTQSAQMAASATKTIPILFGAVTDPVEAQLVATIDKPGGNITGSSDQWPVREQLLLLQEMAPGLKSIGVVHNPGEANSEANMKVVRALCREFGWTLVEAPAATTNDVYRAAASLKGRCDGMYVPASNTVIEAADAVAIAAAEAHVPVVAGEETAVQKGAIATFSINYADIGRLNAQQAVRILKGEAQPGDLPVAVPTQFELVINRAAAARIGVDLPPQMIARAKRIIE